MNDGKKLKPYADVKAKVREYTDKEGKTKGVYIQVGTLFATPHLSHMSMKIDAIPVGEGWNGWVSIFKRDDFVVDEEVIDVNADNIDQPINLDDIPF